MQGSPARQRGDSADRGVDHRGLDPEQLRTAYEIGQQMAESACDATYASEQAEEAREREAEAKSHFEYKDPR